MSTNTINTNHTPGPWSYEISNETIWIWGNGKEKIVMHVSNESELKDEVLAENEANAKLIAACPSFFDFVVKKKAQGDKEAADLLNSLGYAD